MTFLHCCLTSLNPRARNFICSKPNRWKALLHSVKLEQTKVAGVEYSLQKLDQLRARLRLILAQHLIASKFYMRR